MLLFFDSGCMTARVTGFPAVGSIRTPRRWFTMEQHPRAHAAGKQTVTVRYDHDRSVYLQFTSQGIVTLAQLSVAAIVSSPPHKLSDEEIALVRGYIDCDEVRKAETQILNDKTVVILESEITNERPNRPLSRAYNVLISIENGLSMDAFSYFAPANTYDQFLPQALEVFKSIKWAEGVANEMSEAERKYAQPQSLKGMLTAPRSVS